MDPKRLASILHTSAQFPKPPDFQPSYGTAGFRSEAALLASTVFRWQPPSPLYSSTADHHDTFHLR